MSHHKIFIALPTLNEYFILANLPAGKQVT